MLTPGYGLTATERVLPNMMLDFTTASLDARVTITRALNTATRVNSSGFVEVVNADLPRFDFDPVSLVCKGLLIEEARQNLLLYSQDFSQATWSKNNTNLGTNGTSPSNTSDAALLIPNNVNTSHSTLQNAVSVSGSNGIHTLFAKAGGYSKIGLRESATSGAYAAFNLTGSGSVITSSGVIANSVDIKPYKDGWFRLIMGVNVASQRFTIYPMADGYTSGNPDNYSFAGDLTSGVYVWGAGIEAGLFATSYIPTTTTSLTRNADVVNMTGTNFSSWYSSSSAALAAVVIPSIATGTRPIWQLDDTTANEIIALRGNVANPELYIVDNGTPQAQLDAGTITANTQYGLCAAFTANSCAASQNGATPVTTATATMPTVTQARIGSDGSNFLNGVVRTLRYWPQRILNAETQAFSK